MWNLVDNKNETYYRSERKLFLTICIYFYLSYSIPIYLNLFLFIWIFFCLNFLTVSNYMTKSDYPQHSLTFPNFFWFSPTISDNLWLHLNISAAISVNLSPFLAIFCYPWQSVTKSYFLLLYLTIPSYLWSFLNISGSLNKLLQFKLFGKLFT